MAAPRYHFVTHWRVTANCEEVYDLLGDPLDLPRWWPDVYLSVHETKPGGPGGVGREIGLLTKGYLPYRLRWSFRVTESDRPHGFALEAWGDFIGTGRWTFVQSGPEVDITYVWDIVADKPLLRSLSFLLRPLFSWNHRWAMAKGEESLRRELERRARGPA
ncbi:MAG: SRPBCC family protein [Fimbriimonadaceae bacterium]|nr:SRPBCC family protein [Fimbriimonadaceae bacterium]